MRHAVVLVALLGCGKSESSKKAPATEPPAKEPVAKEPAADEPASVATDLEPLIGLACKLISEADATAALGRPAKFLDLEAAECMIVGQGRSDDSISFGIYPGTAVYEARLEMEDARKIAGLGDGAVFVTDPSGRMIDFAVLKNGKTIDGVWLGVSAGPDPGLEKRLAILVSRIALKL